MTRQSIMSLHVIIYSESEASLPRNIGKKQSPSKPEVFSEEYPALFNCGTKCMALVSYFWFHISYLMYVLDGVRCLSQGWNVDTLGNTLSECTCDSGPQGRPLRGLCYPVHSPCSFGCMHKSDRWTKPIA